MRFITHCVFICCLVSISKWSVAQSERLITADFVNVKFDVFISGIKDGSGYRFFYNQVETDSLIVNVKADRVTIPELMEKVLAQTEFHFSIDSDHNLYITKYLTIQTEFPAEFFISKSADSTSEITSLSGAPNATNKLRQKATIVVDEKVYVIGSASSKSTGTRATISGYVKDGKNGEPIAGASVYVESMSNGAITDQFGYYTFTLPKGRHVLDIVSVGMKMKRRTIVLSGDGKMNVEMEDNVATLKEVIVNSQRRSNVRSLQMGSNQINIRAIKQVPVVFGEADILKVITTLPGVTTVGEASSGFNVRGGSTDQNLVLFNDATIYNSSHLFGFFSVFNPDIVKDVQLYKSAIPEKYGGRLSSVLEVTSKEGNSKKLTATGGIGPLTSKLTLEGPIVKDRTSFIVSGRFTYSDWLLRNIKATEYKNSTAGFSDVALHINHAVNDKNTLYINAYLSNDRFGLNKDTVYKYSNQNVNLKWKHNFTNRFYGVFLSGLDHYQYSITGAPNSSNAYKLSFAIDQVNLRTDFTYAKNSKHTFNFGFGSIYYKLHPGNYQPLDQHSLVTPNTVATEQALESAVYFADQVAVSSKLSVNAGLRYSLYTYLGPQSVNNYVPGLPKNENTITGANSFSSGKVITTYGGPELRLAARYALSVEGSIKLSYNSLRQYIHLLSNTTSISPTDVWKLSDTYIKPQTGGQVSLGYYQNFYSDKIETSLEIYYKYLNDFLDYKSGSSILLNHHVETEVIGSKGKGYGAELLIKKVSGKLNGWISYTYSRTFLKTHDATAGELINDGTFYPANYDKPHSTNLIANYRFSHRLSISFNVVYSTGRPITLPIALFEAGGAQRVLYSDRNQYRIPDYFRSDFSVTLEGNHKIKQFAHNSWSFGFYNLTARKNPYSVYFAQQNGLVKGYQLSIFGTIIPFLTYNFRI